MAFQVPGTDDCDEHAAKISEVMEGVVNDFSPKGCESVEMNSFLLADTQLPILASEEAWNKSDSLFGLLALKKDEGCRGRSGAPRSARLCPRFRHGG